MTEEISTENKKKNKKRGLWLLLIAVITSPFICCLVTVLPVSWQPPMFNLFAVEVMVTNQTNEVLYLTPITTTTGEPLVITQMGRLRQVMIPVGTGKSINMVYDAADRPLDGLVVCRTTADCRMLNDQYGDMVIRDFGQLPYLERGWLAAVEDHPRFGFFVVLYPLLGLIPVGFFLWWVVLLVKNGKMTKPK